MGHTQFFSLNQQCQRTLGWVLCELLHAAAGKSDADKSSAAGTAAAAMGVVSSEPVVINAKSYQSRLGLARCLSRQSADLNEIKKLYIEAIDMAPNVSYMKSL